MSRTQIFGKYIYLKIVSTKLVLFESREFFALLSVKCHCLPSKYLFKVNGMSCISVSIVGRCFSVFPANIYLFKVNNRSTRKMCEMYSKLTKTPERR